MLVRVCYKNKEQFSMVTNQLPEIGELVHVMKRSWKNKKILRVRGMSHHLSKGLHEVYLYLK